MTRNDLSDVDQCVMCGLCLPHCPTYQLSRVEGESPRGRLALMKALDSGAVEVTNDRLAYHLDRCLGCRACEAMCPSNVPYFRLMDAARARIYEASGPGRYGSRARMALKLTASTTATRLAGTFSGIMGVRSSYHGSVPGFDIGLDSDKGQVFLFTGCTSSLVDPGLAEDAVLLLNLLGFGVIRSAPGVCCGALNRHAGNRDVADRQQTDITGQADQHPDLPVLSLATGCASELSGYPDAFSKRHQEITAFLADHADLERLEYQREASAVAVHVPCTQRNVLKQPEATWRLLDSLPGVNLKEIPLNYGCCGAGGLNQFEQKDIGEALLDPVLDWIEREQPEVIVSPNVGCSLHLQKGIERQGLSLKLMHPLQFLASRIQAA